MRKTYFSKGIQREKGIQRCLSVTARRKPLLRKYDGRSPTEPAGKKEEVEQAGAKNIACVRGKE